MQSLLAFFVFGLTTLLTFNAHAMSEIVCQGKFEAVDTTVVVKNKGKIFTLSVYRVVSGHAVQPEVITVHTLPATRGPVVAFGSADQAQVLVFNLNQRNSRGDARGTYTDSIQKTSVSVTCK